MLHATMFDKTELELMFQRLFKWKDLHQLDDLFLKLAYNACEQVYITNGLLDSYQKMSIDKSRTEYKLDLNQQITPCEQCEVLKKKLDDTRLLVADIKTDMEKLSNNQIRKQRQIKRKLCSSVEDKKDINKNDIIKMSLENIENDDINCIPLNNIKKEMESPVKDVSEINIPTSPVLDRNAYKLTKLQNTPDFQPLKLPAKRMSPSRDTLKNIVNNKLNNSSPSLLSLNNKVTGTKEPTDKALKPSKLQTDSKDNINNVIKNSPKKVKVSRNKNTKLKQTLLSYDKFLIEKPPLDLSSSDNFCGGTRANSNQNLSAYDENAQFKEEIKLPMQDMSIKEEIESGTEDDDVIAASPMLPQSKTKKQKSRNKWDLHEPELTNIGSTKGQIPDDDETMVYSLVHPNVLKEYNKIRNKNVKKNDISLVQDDVAEIDYEDKVFNPITKNSKSSDEFMYKEPTVRKQTERKKLQGWSCQKCKDFYESAYKGNEEMKLKMMNNCSRHRGKFNPEKYQTPAGYWDLRFSPTQDED